jgi:hypothetical protein
VRSWLAVRHRFAFDVVIAAAERVRVVPIEGFARR